MRRQRRRGSRPSGPSSGCPAAAEPPAEKRGKKAKEGSAAGGKVFSFQWVLNRLHTRVPADKLGEVSFAYGFICLLHLANEKTLEVLGDGDMNDMRVRFPA